MSERITPRISLRKTPSQARSTRLVSDILEAAAHVLARDGAHRFTTARVAERAGVSVGSLYQYFPNKEAILFRLQTDEWRQTTGVMQDILADPSMPPFERLRAVVRFFFRSECEEAALRVALGDAAPLYREATEISGERQAGKRRIMLFMAEAAPGVSERDRASAAELMMISMEAAGKAVSEDGRGVGEVDRLATAMGDMFCAYLDRLIADADTARN